jgi:hypothetical protein
MTKQMKSQVERKQVKMSLLEKKEGVKKEGLASSINNLTSFMQQGVGQSLDEEAREDCRVRVSLYTRTFQKVDNENGEEGEVLDPTGLVG